MQHSAWQRSNPAVGRFAALGAPFFAWSWLRMARVRMLLLVVAALLVGFVPGAALAHDGENHKASSPHGGAGSSIIERHDWSPVCPPGSGHVCSCDNLSLSDAGAKPVPVVRCTVSFLPPRVAEAVASAEAETKPSPQFSPSLPRAPPLV
jgi:hypothetical protein